LRYDSRIIEPQHARKRQGAVWYNSPYQPVKGVANYG
jgi:hypothetical protein